MSHAGEASPDIYTPQYYERIAALESRHWWHLGMQSIALSLLRSGGRRVYERVLDAGCGTGGMMRWAERNLSPSAVTGIDVAPEALAHCRTGSPSWQVSEASVLDLPFPDGAFDLVISNDVLQHLATDGGDLRGLSEMARVLAPGGALLLRTNSRLGMWQSANARDADYQRYLLEEVRAMVSKAGLSVFRASYANLLGSLHESLRRLLRGRPDHSPAPVGEHGGRSVYEGLRIRNTAASHPLVNRILRSALNAEAGYLAGPGRGFSFGHSIVIVALKPKADAVPPKGDRATPPPTFAA